MLFKRYIRDVLITTVNPYKHEYISGRSLNSALDLVDGWIKKFLDNKESDFYAFDKITLSKIIYSLINGNVPQMVSG